jgi:hypothetical protein
MTDESAPPVDDPHELLASVHDLTRKVRNAQRGTWFPLLLFALVSFGAIPVARHSGRRLGECVLVAGPDGQAGRVCGVYALGLVLYWSIALLLAYAVIAGFYVYRSRRRGVGTPVRPYVLVGAIVTVLATAASLWGAYHPLGIGTPGTTLSEVANQLRSPAAAIGLALLVLAWVEGNRALAWFSLGYLIVVGIPASRFPGVGAHHMAIGTPLPRQLTIAGLLLLGGLAFAVARPAVPREAP